MNRKEIINTAKEISNLVNKLEWEFCWKYANKNCSSCPFNNKETGKCALDDIDDALVNIKHYNF